MILSQFEGRFPTEESCVSYFRDIRLRQGVICPKCGGNTCKWLHGRKAFQCTGCGYSIPLTKGTVMEHSKLSLRTWFYAMHLMTSIKQVLSAKEVQYQLRIDQYPPVWLMMMKLRSIMGKRESIYQLSDEVELDEAFFPIRTPEDARGQKIKRGVGSQQQAKVLVIVESKPVDSILCEYLSMTTVQSIEKAGKLTASSKRQTIGKVVHYIKMFVIDNLSSETLNKIVRKHVEKDTVIITDGSSSHVKFKEYFKRHEQYVEYNVDDVVKTNLPWVHVVIGRCRNGIAAIHGEVDKQFLQLYLNEFCWKFNRRFFRDSNEPKYDLFDRLVKIAACYTSDIKWRDYDFTDDEII
ncbi:IS1595 family transposase [Parabacteroides segnis]|uniref:IS1595 family transposase n=1 Tax=Parabacteroides segnis TaxID=2763058 RepID=UPI003514DD54